MDGNLRHIKVKRVYPKLHLRSWTDNENISLSDSNFLVRRRERIDAAMFSVVKVNRDENERSKDGTALWKHNKNEASQRKISSPCDASDNANNNEALNESFLMEKTREDCVLRRARSGSGSMVFPSIKVKRRDSDSSNAQGYPINLPSNEYVFERPNGWKEDKEIEQELKSRPRAVSFSNQSLLYSAISRDDVAELSELIDSENLDPNIPDEVGITMLHRAAIDGSYRCLNFLLSRGAEINVTDQDGWTPLHDAVFHGHIRCAVFLLTSGADVEAETKDFLKPIEMADDDDMILIVGRAMALNKTGQNSQNSGYDKETLV